MTILALIIGSLALVAATVSVLLTVKEGKRSRERNAAYAQTLRTAVQEHRAALEEFVLEQIRKAEESTAQKTGKMERRLADLEGGVIPDYEKAKQAAQAVNDFSAGISGILGFDPMDALKQRREKDGDS